MVEESLFDKGDLNGADFKPPLSEGSTLASPKLVGFAKQKPEGFFSKSQQNLSSDM